MATSVKTPPEKHFPEITGRPGILEKEDARHRRIANGLHNSGRCQTEAPHDKDDAEHDTPHQTTRMQNIRPDDRTDTAPPGIEPDQSDQESRIDCERHAERVEHQHLQHGADDINFQCRGEHFGYEKEPGPRKVGRHTETSVEIFVQGDYLQPVEKRNQHEGDHHLPDGKTQHHLQEENESAATDPGTDTKVMPDIAAPTIAKAATYQGFSRLPVKSPCSTPAFRRFPQRRKALRYTRAR